MTLLEKVFFYWGSIIAFILKDPNINVLNVIINAQAKAFLKRHMGSWHEITSEIQKHIKCPKCDDVNNNNHDLDINSPKQKVYSKFKCTDTIFITWTHKFKCTKCNYEFSQKDELKMGMGSGKWDILKL